MKINNHKRYLAHSPNQLGKADLLSSHLQDVASRAAEYAEEFGRKGTWDRRIFL
ncbi:MAG TPA: hypothetical protein VM123_02340 [archaeon]|nr:hypothetical protein [archaeon]